MQEKWTSDNGPYVYLEIDEKEAQKDAWKHCYDTVDKRDNEICKDMQDEIASLLVIVSIHVVLYKCLTLRYGHTTSRPV
jgi:hypothetical protein